MLFSASFAISVALSRALFIALLNSPIISPSRKALTAFSVVPPGEVTQDLSSEGFMSDSAAIFAAPNTVCIINFLEIS